MSDEERWVITFVTEREIKATPNCENMPSMYSIRLNN
jgi:hypothetical protein